VPSIVFALVRAIGVVRVVIVVSVVVSVVMSVVVSVVAFLLAVLNRLWLFVWRSQELWTQLFFFFLLFFRHPFFARRFRRSCP